MHGPSPRVHLLGLSDNWINRSMELSVIAVDVVLQNVTLQRDNVDNSG